ncbi:T9SS type A sorting domain-containing protein [candidate division WOR-3 bacterium]|nr:T9SS type A sorting domain-containing protein [candidate division WOR-3 bacterium]
MLVILFIMITQQWMSFLNSNKVNDIVLHGDSVWAATTGGALIFNKKSASFTHITNIDGLLSNNVKRVEMDIDGNLWFLCRDGGITLMSQDMIRIREFTSITDKLPSYEFSSIFIDGNIIWVGTDDREKVWVYDTQGNPFGEGKATLEKIEPTNEVNTIVGIGDSIWFGTNSGIGILKKGDTSWTIYNITDGLPSDTVLAIKSWGGWVWAGTKKGIARLTQSGWEIVDSSFKVINEDTIWMRAYDFCSTDTSFWAACNFGVQKWEDGTWRKIYGFNSRSAMFNSFLWIGSWGRGIVKYDGVSPNEYIPEGPASNFFSDVAVDQKGNLWCTHYNGIHKVSKLYHDECSWRWKIYNSHNEWGISGSGPRYAVVDRKNNKWITIWDASSTLGVVKILPDESIIKFKLEGGNLANVIGGVCLDYEDNLWVGCWDGYIRRIKDDVVDITISNNYTQCVRILVFDLEKNLWVGTTSGLTIFLKQGGFYRIEGFPSEEIKSITVSKKGEVWIGTGGGAYKIKDKKIVLFISSTEMGGAVVDIVLDTKGGVWFAVENKGIKKLNLDGTFKAYSERDGLVSEDVTSLVFDKEFGILWIGTHHGLSGFSLGIAPQPFPQVKVYPNPFVSSKGHREIVFSSKGLKNGKINIYTLSGRLVKSIKNIKTSFAYWDGRNENKEPIASGIYVFIAYAENGERKVGKIAVVR